MSEVASPDGAGLTPSLAARLEAICDRFEAAWRGGQRPGIADFWDEQGGAALLRDLLVVELAYRARLGERPGPGEYLARFPAQSAAVRSAFETLPATCCAPSFRYFSKRSRCSSRILSIRF